jgi:rhodanese-related sulfurtransferase
MHWMHFLQILGLSGALAGYSAWTLTAHPLPPMVIEKTLAGIPLLRLEQAEALWHDRSTLFLDVRSSTDYEFGHIPGAINVPEPEFEKRFPALKDQLTRAKTIVVYCKSEDCGLSLWAALRLRNEGLTQATIYYEGWNRWYNANLPVSRSQR